MLKNHKIAFSIRFSIVIVIFYLFLGNINIVKISNILLSINAKSSRVANFKVLTTQQADSSLDVTLNLADLAEPYSPPDNGSPKRSQGSGTRNQ